jgi:hypothetical protein
MVAKSKQQNDVTQSTGQKKRGEANGHTPLSNSLGPEPEASAVKRA